VDPQRFDDAAEAAGSGRFPRRAFIQFLLFTSGAVRLARAASPSLSFADDRLTTPARKAADLCHSRQKVLDCIDDCEKEFFDCVAGSDPFFTLACLESKRRCVAKCERGGCPRGQCCEDGVCEPACGPLGRCCHPDKCEHCITGDCTGCACGRACDEFTGSCETAIDGVEDDQCCPPGGHAPCGVCCPEDAGCCFDPDNFVPCMSCQDLHFYCRGEFRTCG
jgi:hypothetical protein